MRYFHATAVDTTRSSVAVAVRDDEDEGEAPFFQSSHEREMGQGPASGGQWHRDIASLRSRPPNLEALEPDRWGEAAANLSLNALSVHSGSTEETRKDKDPPCFIYQPPIPVERTTPKEKVRDRQRRTWEDRRRKFENEALHHDLSLGPPPSASDANGERMAVHGRVDDLSQTDDRPLVFPSDPIAGASQFDSLISSDPIRAFRELPRLPVEVADTLTYQQYDRLFVRLRQARSNHILHHKLSPEDSRATLEWLKSSSPAHPLPMITKHADQGYPSEFIAIRTCRGFRFRDFVRLSTWLQSSSFDIPLFNSLYLPHFERGDILELPPGAISRQIWTASLAEDLTMLLKVEESWTTIVSLFAHPHFPSVPLNFPMRFWTPKILSRVMLAFLNLRNMTAIPAIWKLYEEHDRPPPDNAVVYQRLMHAHIKLGNMSEVKRFQQISRDQGFTGTEDNLWESLHLLDGQKQYGPDSNLEAKVMQRVDEAVAAIDQGEDVSRKLTAEAVHRIISLRLSASDLVAAEALLHCFSLPSLPPRPSLSSSGVNIDPHDFRLIPTRKTLRVALEVFIRQNRLDFAWDYWNRLVSAPVVIRDAHLVHWVDLMAASGLLRDAFDIIQRYVAGEKTATSKTKSRSSHQLPPGRCAIGIRTMNALLRHMGRDHQIPGVIEVFELMRKNGIEIDTKSITWIMRTLAHPRSVHPKSSTDPVTLAATLSLMLQNASVSEPTMDHLNVIMSSAIQSLDPAADLTIESASIEGLTDPAGGVRPVGRFKTAVQPILDNMTARWLTADSSAFAYRLCFAAMTDRPSGGESSARDLWNQLVTRGYRLDKRHLIGLVRGYSAARNMEQAQAVLALAGESGNVIDRSLLRALMNGWGDSDNAFRARQVYEQIRDLGRTGPHQGLTEMIVTSMISIYTRCDKAQMAVDLFQHDLAPVYKSPDDVSLNVAGSAFRAVGNPAAALEMLEHYRPDGKLDVPLRKLLKRARGELENMMAERRATERDIWVYRRSWGVYEKAREYRKAEEARARRRAGKGANGFLSGSDQGG